MLAQGFHQAAGEFRGDRLVLVQVGNEQILLGLTPGRITPLHVLKEPLPADL